MKQEIINEATLTALIQQKLAGLIRQPGYNWPVDAAPWQLDEGDLPLIRVALGTCPSDFDLWGDIRSPATVGLHPVGLPEVWDFYRTQVQTQVKWDNDNYYRFQVPSFDDFPYAAVLSVMAVASPKNLEAQAQLLDQGLPGSADYYTTAWGCLSAILESALARSASTLYSDSMVSVPMIGSTLTCLNEEIIPAYHKGNRHGPSKGGNWPQKSVAFMTGLAQFGASHLVFRDEVVDGEVQRMIGQIRSMVLFSREDNLRGGVKLDDVEYRQLLHRLARFDKVEASDDVSDLRFCRYGQGCAACIAACPSGALQHSTPQEGSKRARRHDGWLQFADSPCRDYARHAQVLPEWVCARCVVACARRGKTNVDAVERYWALRKQD